MKINAIDTYTDLELALMVLLGYLGNGAKRKAALGSRYNAVQGLVDQILRTGSVPAGSAGGAVDPDQLKKAIDKSFEEVIADLEEEIIANYEG